MTDNQQSTININPISTEIEIVSLLGKFSDDHKRVRVEFELSDVSQKPNAELSLLDQDGTVMAHTVILGVLDRWMHFTLHLRKHPNEEPVWVKALLRTDDNQCLAEKTEQVQYQPSLD